LERKIYQESENAREYDIPKRKVDEERSEPQPTNGKYASLSQPTKRSKSRIPLTLRCHAKKGWRRKTGVEGTHTGEGNGVVIRILNFGRRAPTGLVANFKGGPAFLRRTVVHS